jgi:hypothetical protein
VVLAAVVAILLVLYANIGKRSDYPGRVLAWSVFIGIVSAMVFGGTMLVFWFDARRDSRMNRLACAACGYSLEGLTSDRCPECGEGLSSGS